LFAAGVARAEDLTAANAAFDNRDYRTAFRLYQPLAEQGNTAAESALGSMYFYGRGVQKDDVQAYMWFSLAAGGAGGISDVAKTNRAVVGRMMTSTQMALAERLVRRCLDSQFKQCRNWTSKFSPETSYRCQRSAQSFTQPLFGLIRNFSPVDFLL
jgi:hypothetical protein